MTRVRHYPPRSRPQRHYQRIIRRIAVIVRPLSRFLEAECAIESLGAPILRPYFQENVPSMLHERMPHQLSPDPPSPQRWIDSQVQDLQLVRDRSTKHQETNYAIAFERDPTARQTLWRRQETAIRRRVPWGCSRRSVLDLHHPLNIPAHSRAQLHRSHGHSLRQLAAPSRGFGGNETRSRTVSSLRAEGRSEVLSGKRVCPSMPVRPV